MIKIRKYGDKILKEIAREVTEEEIQKSIISHSLLETWQSVGKAQGISAPQIGISKRAVLCRISKIPIIMYNPVILKKYGFRKSNEGCESVNGRYIVKRPLFGKVQYQDLKGNIVIKWYRFRWLRIICHEVDHLNGICINEIGVKWVQ